MADQNVAIIGQGYVGLPVSIRAVEVGFDVVGFDVDASKIDGLVAGCSHIDDVTDEDVTRALATGRFTPSSSPRDVAGFDVAVVTVPTPLYEGAPDTRYIEAAAELLARFLRPGATVVLESTTYPGTTEELFGPILEAGSGLTAGIDFHLGFSPERIDPGNKDWDFRRTPKVVSGVDDTSLKAVQDFYDQLVDRTVSTTGTREAELSKLLENTFRHVNIALVNELAVNARALGIDFWDVVQAAESKPFGFMPFFPGPGVGGHCLPIDPSYLSWKFERQLGTVSRFVKIANDINNGMPGEVVRRVQLALNARSKPVRGSRVLVLGASYKKNSKDARETPVTPIVEQLCDLGADLRLHDTWVDDSFGLGIPRVSLTVAEISSADTVLLLTDHDDVDYQLVLNHASHIFDARHRVAGENVEYL